ncbi:hypothetical protein, partial [Shigella boydii]
DGNGSHASTLKSPSYTKSVSWQHYRGSQRYGCNKAGYKAATYPSCQNNGCLANGMRSYKNIMDHTK